MSIDVEDWFHVDNLKSAISRDSWNQREVRVERNVRVILEELDRTSTKATFFILGWVAERSPGLIKAIHGSGHEIAAHGFAHELVYQMDPSAFREDVRKSKDYLEQLTGEAVVGYRAPNFSITDWAIDTLVELGFRYDSSLFPTMIHDRYGKLSGVQMPERGYAEVRKDFYEIFLSCLPLQGSNIPWSGGAYFRLIPYPVFRMGMKRILRARGTYCFYIHPWEFDPDQPRVPHVKLFHRFRHYSNLMKTQPRYASLLKDFRFQPIRDVLPASRAQR